MSLTSAIDVLSDSGCLEDDLANDLAAQIGEDEEAFLELLADHETEICAEGVTLLTSITSGGEMPYFESGRVVFDSDADDCVDSVFDEESGTITSYDSNGDGCLDQLNDFWALLNDLQAEESAAQLAAVQYLTTDLTESLQINAEQVLGYLFPPTEEDQASLENYEYDT